jgi:copper chaperone
VTKAIHSVDPAAEVRADPGTHKVEVKSAAPREQLAAALTEVGYAPT